MKKDKLCSREISIRILLGVCAFVTIATTISIITILASESWGFFKEVPLMDFLFGIKWTPLLEPQSFGVLPLVTGTFLVTLGAALMAIPLGIITATYLSEYADPKVRSLLKPILEILAGIPTIVYGFFALTFITPILKIILPATEIFNALSGAIVVGIMILPMITSLCDDAFLAVPRDIKNGGYALGATSFEVISKLLIPCSISRILSAFLLAISRAIGETMAVTLAAGANPQLTFNPLQSIQTMTAYIVQISMGDIPSEGIAYKTCFAVGALLFVLTFLMNIAGHRLLMGAHSK